MNARFLLDTNILSNLVRYPQGIVARRIASEGETSVCTSVIVAAELRFGALKRGSVRLARQLETILSAIDVLSLEQPADQHYGTIRAFLERKGKTIGPNNMLIAAHALSIDCAVITANQREFSRVPGLKVEDWLDE